MIEIILKICGCRDAMHRVSTHTKQSFGAFWILAILLAFLPLHAFLVTSLNALFGDANIAPPVWLKIWKEGLIVLLFLLWLWQIIRRKIKVRFDLLDLLILIYLFWGMFSAFLLTKQISVAIMGAKYDFTFLFFFLLVRRFDFAATQKERLLKIILNTAIIVICFGLLQQFFLPEKFLTFLGYSTDHSHFSPDKPLAYCQKISGTEQCRLQSFLSGPNQLASYLLVVLPLFLTPFFTKLMTKKNRLVQFFQKLYSSLKFVKKSPCQGRLGGFTPLLWFLLGMLTLFFAYSRASWVGFLVMSGIALFWFLRHQKNFWEICGSLAAVFILAISLLFFSAPQFFQQTLFRPSSTQGHFERMADGIKWSIANPLGLGLGKAGPASNYFAKDYLGFIPESWYLQISLELGIPGMILYLGILAALWQSLRQKALAKNSNALALLLSLSGLMVASFFLHSWEDSATALTFWGMAGLILPAVSSPKP